VWEGSRDSQISTGINWAQLKDMKGLSGVHLTSIVGSPANERIVIASSPRQLYKSVDGVSWSKVAGPNLGSDTNINDYKQHPSLAYGAGRFVLASDSGRIFSSPDLLTWTRSTVGTRRIGGG